METGRRMENGAAKATHGYQKGRSLLGGICNFVNDKRDRLRLRFSAAL